MAQLWFSWQGNPDSGPTDRPTDCPRTRPIDRSNVRRSACPTARPAAWSDRPTDRPRARPSDRPTVPTKRPIARPTDRPTERLSNRSSDRPTDRPIVGQSDRPTTRPTARLSDRPTVRATDRPIVRSSDRPTGRSSDRPTDCPTVRLSGRSTDPPVDRPAARLTDRPADRPTVRLPARPAARPSHRFRTCWAAATSGGNTPQMLRRTAEQVVPHCRTWSQMRYGSRPRVAQAASYSRSFVGARGTTSHKPTAKLESAEGPRTRFGGACGKVGGSSRQVKPPCPQTFSGKPRNHPRASPGRQGPSAKSATQLRNYSRLEPSNSHVTSTVRPSRPTGPSASRAAAMSCGNAQQVLRRAATLAIHTERPHETAKKRKPAARQPVGHNLGAIQPPERIPRGVG